MKKTFCIVGAPTRNTLKRSIALACFMGLGLAGCGQKGPLTYPQTPAAVPTQTTPQTTAPTPR